MSYATYNVISEYVSDAAKGALALEFVRQYPHTALKFGTGMVGSIAGGHVGKKAGQKYHSYRMKKLIKNKASIKDIAKEKMKAERREKNGELIGRIAGSALGYGAGHAIIQSEKESHKS